MLSTDYPCSKGHQWDGPVCVRCSVRRTISPDITRRIVDLERELHLCWQEIDAQARKVRHVTIELLKIANELSSGDGLRRSAITSGQAVAVGPEQADSGNPGQPPGEAVRPDR